MNKLKEYLESIIDIKYQKLDGYELYEFIATFDSVDKNIKLFVGENNFKITLELECPLCNLEVFSEMNSFNESSVMFKAYHDGNNVVISSFSYYDDIVENIKDILDELMSDDYEMISSLIKVIDKNNKIDKVELLENVIDLLNEGKKWKVILN